MCLCHWLAESDVCLPKAAGVDAFRSTDTVLSIRPIHLPLALIGADCTLVVIQSLHNRPKTLLSELRDYTGHGTSYFNELHRG